MKLIALPVLLVCLITGQLKAQPIPSTDSDLDAINTQMNDLYYKTGGWFYMDCAKFDCAEMQDFNFRLRDAMQTMRYLTYWLKRAGQTPGQDPNRIYQRLKKSETLYNDLKYLIIINNTTKEGELTRWLLKFNTACRLDLGYVARAMVPDAYRVEHFEIISDNDRRKNWQNALNYFNGLLPGVLAALKNFPVVSEIRPDLKLQKSSFRSGEPIALNFTAPVCFPSSSWIGMVKASVTHHNEEINSNSVIGGKSFLNHREEGNISFQAPQEAGNYEFRMYNTENRKEVAVVKFSVRKENADTPAVNIRPAPAKTSWTTTASTLRGQVGKRFSFEFAPGNSDGTVWGSDVYTDDSPIGKAAVHAGLISFQRGGKVTIEIRPGQASYTGSTRNGVTTSNYGSWGGSYIFIR